MSDKAFINPEILKWARESARISLETAAAKINVAADRLKDWEEGTSQPTIRQAENLAKAFRRPFALFFLLEIPNDFQPLQDFRRKNARHLGTASVFIIREIQQKQAWIRDLFEENGEPLLPFIGRFDMRSSPEKVATDILKTLQIDPSRYAASSPIREWIERAEAKRIFISRTSFIHSKLKLDSEELQGFTIADPYAPFVFINSEDWDAPQLFTLVHEIAHLWIQASGISNEVEPDPKQRDKLHPVELFCNEVAAHALMPTVLMQRLETNVFESSLVIFNVAKKIGVSSFALLYRAFSMNLISSSQYRKLKIEADADFKAFTEKEEEKRAQQSLKKGGPDYYMLSVNKNSHLFTRAVMDAFHGGFIQPTQASLLLNTQVNNFPRLEALFPED